jgi:hypothetical protein
MRAAHRGFILRLDFMQRMYEMSVASSVAISSLRSVVNFWPTEMKPCGSSGEMRWESQSSSGAERWQWPEITGDRA